MADADASSEIGIVVYPGAQLAAVHGLTDLLGIASRFASEAGGSLRVSHWSASGNAVACTYRSEPSHEPRPGIVIIPPTLAELPDPQTCEAIADWLLGEHARGAALVTVCSGIFLLAGTGLLDGRMVSTHRSCAKALVDGFPKIAVDTSERMIEHPGILTAGGFLAWVDVALILIERLLGHDVRAETARFALDDHPAGPIEIVAGLGSAHTHGDAAVRRAQELVHLRDGQGVLLAQMASVAGLERRTFLRRFVSATGKTPIEYCRAVQITRARELLEASDTPLKTIAESLGYADVGSFTKAFRRLYGIPPGTYRRRHGRPATAPRGQAPADVSRPAPTSS